MTLVHDCNHDDTIIDEQTNEVKREEAVKALCTCWTGFTPTALSEHVKDCPYRILYSIEPVRIYVSETEGE